MICPGCTKVKYSDRSFSHEAKMIICNNYMNNPTPQQKDFIIDHEIVPEIEWFTIMNKGIQTKMSAYTLIVTYGIPREMNASLDGNEQWRYTFPDSSLLVWIKDKRVQKWR